MHMQRRQLACTRFSEVSRKQDYLKLMAATGSGHTMKLDIKGMVFECTHSIELILKRMLLRALVNIVTNFRVSRKPLDLLAG
jgi:hypothetical protein